MEKSGKDNYKLIGKLIEEIKLRRYSFQTGKSYISIIKEFLKSDLTPRGFLLSYTSKSKSTMGSAYFALKFFHEKVLGGDFKEKFLLLENHQNYQLF